MDSVELGLAKRIPIFYEVELQVDPPPFGGDAQAELETGCGKPGWSARALDQSHARLRGGSSAFALVAWFAGSDDVLPAFCTALHHRSDVVQSEVRLSVVLAAILAAVFVSNEDVGAREPDDILLSFERHKFKEPQDRRYAQCDANGSDLAF